MKAPEVWDVPLAQTAISMNDPGMHEAITEQSNDVQYHKEKEEAEDVKEEKEEEQAEDDFMQPRSVLTDLHLKQTTRG